MTLADHDDDDQKGHATAVSAQKTPSRKAIISTVTGATHDQRGSYSCTPSYAPPALRPAGCRYLYLAVYDGQRSSAHMVLYPISIKTVILRVDATGADAHCQAVADIRQESDKWQHHPLLREPRS